MIKKTDEVKEMIWTQTPPGGTFSSVEEYETYREMIKEYDISAYDDFVATGHEWCWCLVGNIVESHEYGESHELKEGTKQFSKGSKVYLAPGQWAAGKLSDVFPAIDLAKTADGRWILIEVNDAQESGFVGLNSISLWRNVVEAAQDRTWIPVEDFFEEGTVIMAGDPLENQSLISVQKKSLTFEPV